MDPIYDQLLDVVKRIEMTSLSEEDKVALFTKIKDLLDATVLPILARHLPQEQLTALSSDTSKVSVETYSKLIVDTFKDGVALQEADKALKDVVQKIDSVLKEEGL